MKIILDIVITFSVLYISCYAVPLELIENLANCTKIGVAIDCCETHGCAFVNCTDGLRCIDARNASSWADTCETAVNQCLEVFLGSGTTPYPGYNDTTTPYPGHNGTTTIPDTSPSGIGTTNGTSPPVTMTTTSGYGNTTDNETTLTPVTSSFLSVVAISTAVRTTNTTSDDWQPGQDHGQSCRRQFDGASFVGGMVFMVGVVAIGAFIYVYCRSQGNDNYRLI